MRDLVNIPIPGFPFRMLSVIKPIPINLKIVSVSQMHFGYKHHVDFFVKQVSHFQFSLAVPFSFQ